MSDDNENELIPKGYRFYPTEEELLSFYLHNKLEKIRELDIERVIPVSNIYSVDPWQLPDMSGEPCRIEGSEQWFFFCPRQPREAHGGRPTRTTPSGYWKATGSPGPVYSSMNRARAIGVKKTMVFYRGRAPCGIKTKWKMNEYRALVQVEYCINVHGSSPELRNEFSLCRVYKNSGCMRAFDRRPSIVASTSEINPNASPSDNRNHHGKKRARSLDISSSTDNDNNWNPAASLQEGAMDLNLIEDIDWDKLDWV